LSKETVRVPDIGGADAAEVVELLVAVGDDVELEQGLIVLESDKASLEIPSTVAGRVLELLASEGAQLAEGDPVAIIETVDTAVIEDTANDASEPSGAPAEASAESAAPSQPAAQPDGDAALGDSGAKVTVEVPDIGTDDAVDVVEIPVGVGDNIREGDTLVVLESDKASMEVPSTVAGTVTSLHVQEGGQLRQGDAVADIATVAGAASSSTTAVAPAAKQAPTPEPAATAAKAQTPESPTRAPAASQSAEQPPIAGSDSYAGPAVRRLAREFGVPLDKVSGSGPKGRVLKEDLHQYVQRALEGDRPSGGAGLPEVPEVDFSKFGSVQVGKRSKIAVLTANNMQRSWLNVPHVTQFDDIDITELEEFRKSLKAEGEARGVKMTPIPLILKACAAALKRNEKMNASLSDGGSTLTLKRYVHIGMAVDTPAGLVVPVLRDVDQKSLWEIAEEVTDLATRARERKLKPQEMQGGSFTVSSLGTLGGRGFTPIVNTPEVGILGIGRAQVQPLWDGTAFQPRKQLPVGLSYDHRVVNGGDGGRFLADLKALLEDLRRLLL
jgi:pyruvate dehydrogenase E2 component (dihydrolipoamide acetyltransferase)